MRILDYIKNYFKKKKNIDVRQLPSQGIFYPKNFKVQIKKATPEDIKSYTDGYDAKNVHSVLKKLKYVVESNVILPCEYNFRHIKSIDVVYLFIEIVKFTKNKRVQISFFDDVTGTVQYVDFGPETFNYHIFEDDMWDNWDPIKRTININGYQLNMPTVGVENSLTNYLIEKSYNGDAAIYNEYNYNFTFFLESKDVLRYDEIDNLIQIFNFDLDKEEMDKVNQAIEYIKPMQRYTLRIGNRIIDMGAKINLETIWD